MGVPEGPWKRTMQPTKEVSLYTLHHVGPGVCETFIVTGPGPEKETCDGMGGTFHEVPT